MIRRECHNVYQLCWNNKLIFSLNPTRGTSQTMQSCVLIVLDSKLMGIVTWDFEFSGLTKLDASASNFLHRVCL